MKRLTAILLVAALFLLNGCMAKNETITKNNATSYSVTDDKGRQVNLPKKPVRIVSATYGTDEILAEVVALDPY